MCKLLTDEMDAFGKRIRPHNGIIAQVDGDELRSSRQGVRHRAIRKRRPTRIQHPQRLAPVCGRGRDDQCLDADETRAVVRREADAVRGGGAVCESGGRDLHFQAGIGLLRRLVDDFAERVAVVAAGVVDEDPAGGGDGETDGPLVVVAIQR